MPVAEPQFRAILFGSRAAGAARTDSDYDVLLVGDDEFVHLAPRPLPHDEPGFYGAAMSAVDHHSRKRQWSIALWNALGSDAGIGEVRAAAIRLLKSRGFEVDETAVDLILYLPPRVGATVWAIHLSWHDIQARLDFAVEASRSLWPHSPALAAAHAQIIRPGRRAREMADELTNALRSLAGVIVSESYREYASLGELLRNSPRTIATMAATGLP